MQHVTYSQNLGNLVKGLVQRLLTCVDKQNFTAFHGRCSKNVDFRNALQIRLAHCSLWANLASTHRFGYLACATVLSPPPVCSTLFCFRPIPVFGIIYPATRDGIAFVLDVRHARIRRDAAELILDLRGDFCFARGILQKAGKLITGLPSVVFFNLKNYSQNWISSPVVKTIEHIFVIPSSFLLTRL